MHLSSSFFLFVVDRTGVLSDVILEKRKILLYKKICASTVNRTLGLQIFSLALSQLSYRGEVCCQFIGCFFYIITVDTIYLIHVASPFTLH
jgi:hypothetical protein